jgi:hypothetical protein
MPVKEVCMDVLFMLIGVGLFGAMALGLWRAIVGLIGLVVQGKWKLAAFLVGAFVVAGVAGLILAEVFVFISDAMR